MGSPSQNTSINNSGFPLFENAETEDAPNPSGLFASLPTFDHTSAYRRSNTEADTQEADPLLGLASLPAGPVGPSDVEWSGTEADDKGVETRPSDLPSTHCLGPAGPSCTGCASSHFDLSTLPSHLSELILSKVPVEQQIQWSLVSKTWKELFSSERLLNMFGPNAQPSSTNRPILVSRNSLPHLQASPQSIATYNSRHNIWQGREMTYFMQTRPAGNNRINALPTTYTCGSLIYRSPSTAIFTSTVMIEICNPSTKGYRRLERRQDARGDGRKDLWWREGRKFLVWGLIVDSHLNKYQVIVQNWTVSGADTIRQLLVYDSVADLWETVGPLAEGIFDRVGDYIRSSTSSGGNLYFLAVDLAEGPDAWNRFRLFKYDGKNKSIGEILPLPTFVGRGEPMLLEHKGEIIFVTRMPIQQNYNTRRTTWTSWVFFRLVDSSHLFEQMKVMPLNVLITLRRKIQTEVQCHGNGDHVYFYGGPTSNTGIMRVLVHDFVRNSWTWLPNFPLPENTCHWNLVSVTPSFMKV